MSDSLNELHGQIAEQVTGDIEQLLQQDNTMSQTYHQAVDELNSKLDNIQSEIESLDAGGSSDDTVTNFGARGNGNDDDTNEIQEAIITIHENGGGKAIFPPGEYKISEQLIGKDNVSLEGAGAYQSIIHQEDSSEYGVNLSGASNLKVENLGFTHKHNLQPQEKGQLLFSGKAVENVTVEDCAFIEPARQAVGFWSSGNKNIKFLNNDLMKCPRAGVVIFGEGINVDGCYLIATGDDAIALNTDHTKNSAIRHNIIIDGAMVGEQHGGAIKFHGSNMDISHNIAIDSNFYGIRGQIVDENSGEGVDDPPHRNHVSDNIVIGIKNTTGKGLRAGLEMREMKNTSMVDNEVYDVGNNAAILIRNNERHKTRSKLHGNFIQGAKYGVYSKNQHDFMDVSNNTFFDVERVLHIRDEINQFHMNLNKGHNISDSIMNMSGVDFGTYTFMLNWFSDAPSTGISGNASGGEFHNYLNYPSGASINPDTYKEVAWSDLT